MRVKSCTRTFLYGRTIQVLAGAFNDLDVQKNGEKTVPGRLGARVQMKNDFSSGPRLRIRQYGCPTER